MSFALRRNKTTSDTPDTESKIRIRTIETIDVTVMIGSAISAFALSQLLRNNPSSIWGVGFSSDLVRVFHRYFLARRP